MPLVLQIIAGCLTGGFLSVLAAGLVMWGLKRQWLPRMVSFSAGLLLAVALLDLLPEAVENSSDPHQIFQLLLAGLLGFFCLERFAHWRHAHEHGDEDDDGIPHFHSHHHHSTAPLIIIGDSFHNFTDGILLAASFLASPALGWSTALAIVAHEIPQEAGDFALLLEAGLSKTRALFWNGVSSFFSVAGGVIGYFALDHAREWVPATIAIAAAGFIYISIADLLPRLHRERKDFHWHALFLFVGVLVVALGLGHHHH